MLSGPARTPRPSFGFNSDGRSPDLRVIALPTFPAFRPVVFRHRSPLTVAGAVAALVHSGIAGQNRTVFPFHPDPCGAGTIIQSLAPAREQSQADLQVVRFGRMQRYCGRQVMLGLY